MKKSIKFAIIIFLSSTTVLFIIFSPILLKKDQFKNPPKNQVLAENNKKDFSDNSVGAAIQVKNRPENNSESKKESVNAENSDPSQSYNESEEIIKEEIVEAPSIQAEQSFPTPVPSPLPTLITNPTPPSQKLMTVEIQGLANYSDYSVEVKENDTAFTVLLRASEENNFTLEYQNYEGLGVFVNCITGICDSQDNKYWMFYYNGQLSRVGASSQSVSATDITTWKFE